MQLLLIEDEIAISDFIREGLEEEGFKVKTALNGKTGLEMALCNAEEYDLLLLDWMLPGASGIDICRAVRRENRLIPIIFLTAKDTADEAVFALEAGANDFIRKPFVFEELLARIRVLLRSKTGEQTVFHCNNIQLDLEKHLATKNNQVIPLTQKEFALLEYLLRHRGKVCRRNRIMERIWDIQFSHSTAVIDVYINSLRKKFDDPDTNSSFITTVRGIGYRIEEES